jgi:hypothetical protein
MSTISFSKTPESSIILPTNNGSNELDIPKGLPDRYSVRLERAIRHLASADKTELAVWNTEEIQKWLFLNATQSLYREFDFSTKEIKVLIIGVVGPDGMGDYFHMLHAAEQIQKAFPGAMISLGVEVVDLIVSVAIKLPLRHFPQFYGEPMHGWRILQNSRILQIPMKWKNAWK